MTEKSKPISDTLLHYGVVGMKWGKRKSYDREIKAATKQHKKMEDSARIAAHAERKGKIVRAATYNAKNQVATSKYNKYIDNAAKLGMSTHNKYADDAKVFMATIMGGPFEGMKQATKNKKRNPHAAAANERRKLQGYK
jgi:hypothetical protein